MKLSPLTVGISAAAWALSTSCVLPTDRGGELRVRITGGMTTMLVADTVRLTVEVVDEDSVVHGNVVALLRSDDQAVLTVDDSGLLRAVGPGEARITARTPQFADSRTDTLVVNVSQGIARGILSFGPSTARFGEIVTIVGTGLDPDSLEFLAIGGVAPIVHRYAPSPGTGGFDSLLVWVTAPAARMSDLIIVRKNGVTSLLPLTVLQQDLYEPNDTLPDADSFLQLAQQLALPIPFSNPALAFEPGTDFGPNDGSPVWFEPISIDLYIVLIEAARDVSFIFSSGTEPRPDVWDGMEMAAANGVASVSPLWLSFRCNGLRFDPDTLPAPFARVPAQVDPQVIALKGFEGSEDFSIFVVGTGRYDPASALTRYSFEVRDEYVSDLSPDDWEENDLCVLASTLPTDDSTSLELTFDNAADYDWFRLLVQDSTTGVTVRVSSTDTGFSPPEILVFEDSSAADFTDIPFTWRDIGVLPLVGRSEVGSDSLRVALAPAGYLLLVANMFTSPSTYTLSVIRSSP